jgi:tripartite-type tricarboxylate transporter receptor subunit TctC
VDLALTPTSPRSPAARRRALRALWLAAPLAALSLAAPAALAQSGFPARAVRIVVPYSVGIGPDVVTRAVAERLSQTWGQPVMVDNKPGASGIVAFSEIGRVAPDGHTLFLGDVATLAVNPLIHANLPYDAARDVAPLTGLFRATFVIQVGGASRYATLADLLADARARPGRVSYASLGNGHPSQVAVESWAKAAGVEFLHVPFKDGGSMMSAVANGEVDFTPLSMNTTAGLTKAGKMRPLAVAARTRLKDYPEIPTSVEAGGPAVEMRPWAALVAPAGTPRPVLEQLQRDLVAAINSPEVRARIEAAGFEPIASTPAELAARVAADTALYAPLVKQGRVRRDN